jgi:hypothetical protein
MPAAVFALALGASDSPRLSNALAWTTMNIPGTWDGFNPAIPIRCRFA